MYYGKRFFHILNNVAEMQIATVLPNQLFSVGLSAITAYLSYIDWGDGSDYTVIDYTVSKNYRLYSHTYAAIGEYRAIIYEKNNIKSFLKINNEGLMSCPIDGMALTYLRLSTCTAVTGPISGMALTYLYLSGTGAAVTGPIGGMALTYLLLSGTGAAVTGPISGMALTYLYLSGTGAAVTGPLPTTSILTNLYLQSVYSIQIPTIGLIFKAGMTYIRVSMTVGLSPSEVDAILISGAATTWALPKVINVAGNNAARTAASDAAIETLINLGVSVTVNNL